MRAFEQSEWTCSRYLSSKRHCKIKSPVFGVKTLGELVKVSHVRAATDVRKKSFATRCVGPWNALPDEIVAEEILGAFKKKTCWCSRWHTVWVPYVDNLEDIVSCRRTLPHAWARLMVGSTSGASSVCGFLILSPQAQGIPTGELNRWVVSSQLFRVVQHVFFLVDVLLCFPFSANSFGVGIGTVLPLLQNCPSSSSAANLLQNLCTLWSLVTHFAVWEIMRAILIHEKTGLQALTTNFGFFGFEF